MRWSQWGGGGEAGRKKRRREGRQSILQRRAACSLPAAPAMHLPPFILLPYLLAERLSKKPNHSSHRFSSIVLASTFMHPFPPPSRRCPTRLLYASSPSLYLPPHALSHASFPTLSSFPSLSTFLRKITDVPTCSRTVHRDESIIISTSFRSLCLPTTVLFNSCSRFTIIISICNLPTPLKSNNHRVPLSTRR